MSLDEQFLILVESARKGQAESLNQLAERVQGRIYAYINRAMLDPDFAQDLTQEVLLAMVRSLNDLDNPERFWPWLYRIAQRKILEHCRAKHRKHQLTKSQSFQHEMAQRARKTDKDAFDKLTQKDLENQTLTAMKKLREQHRAVLALRCFDQLNYTDIAAVMDCSEVKARVLFFRAKQALQKQLIGQGVGKYMLLACLGLFGKLTAPAEAAPTTISVTAASTKVGALATVIAVMTGRWVLSGSALLIVVLGLTFGLSHSSTESVVPVIRGRSDVKSLHFAMQMRNSDPGASGSNSKGAYEQWFYFPEDVDGPFFRRIQRWTPQLGRKQCAWLQNEQGHYYYDSYTQTVTRCNEPVAWSNLNVLILPTDPPEMAAFLEEVQRAYGDVDFTRDPNTQLLREAVDMRFVDAMDFKTEYRYNTIDRGFFTYNWEDDVPVKDHRDEMHKRGWTYVRIEGTIRDQMIVGQGCIPFTYGAYQEHSAWITLTVDNTLTLSDTKQGAWIEGPNDVTITTYPSHAFFCGLMRPWMGMHTMDLVRRDAAWSRRWFRTEKAQKQECAIVTVYDDGDQPHIKLIYTIDIDRDLLERIDFIIDSQEAGRLEFDYLDSVDDTQDVFVKPETDVPLDSPNRPSPGMPWLFKFVDNTFGFRNQMPTHSKAI